VAEEHAEHASYGHSAAEYVVELGRRANAAKVVPLHHRPNRTDEQLDEIATRFAGQEVALATESMVLEL
jgi:ribonuclease BN (tRNA processing enzyme)